MVSAYWYYPQQIYAAKLIKNEQTKKMNFPNKKRAQDVDHLQNILNMA